MIVATNGTLGGLPRIDGHRIGVHHIVLWHAQMTIPELMREFLLTEEEIAEALAYYADHRDEIEAIIDTEDAVYRHASFPHEQGAGPPQ